MQTKNNMKIMFNTSSMGKGGAERVISILANELIKENDVSILLNTKENKAYDLNEKIKLLELDKKYISIALFRNLKRIWTSAKILKKEQPDIIISFLPMPSYRILLLRKLIKVPIIVSDRNDPNKEYKSFISNFLMKRLYPKADGFVFQTEEQKKFFDKNIQDKSIIIYNPIKDEFLNTNKAAQKEDTIISVGRLVEQKNQKMLIEAFSKIAKEYSNYKLKIFGTGPLELSLKKQIENLNLSDRILLCGVCDDIKTELEKAKIFVLSSDYEGMPNALIEAMAVGLPVISTDCPCGGPKELIENKKNGLLIEVGNVERLAKKMKYLIENQEEAALMGKNAEEIKEKLNSINILKQWKIYIEEMKK